MWLLPLVLCPPFPVVGALILLARVLELVTGIPPQMMCAAKQVVEEAIQATRALNLVAGTSSHAVAATGLVIEAPILLVASPTLVVKGSELVPGVPWLVVGPLRAVRKVVSQKNLAPGLAIWAQNLVVEIPYLAARPS